VNKNTTVNDILIIIVEGKVVTISVIIVYNETDCCCRLSIRPQSSFQSLKCIDQSTHISLHLTGHMVYVFKYVVQVPVLQINPTDSK
jgi:hypothetical protein